MGVVPEDIGTGSIKPQRGFATHITAGKKQNVKNKQNGI